jgi:hypothetical protein
VVVRLLASVDGDLLHAGGGQVSWCGVNSSPSSLAAR